MTFSNKLDTTCRLVINRIKLQMNKKAELASRARKEIADLIAAKKIELARAKAELLIQDDYLLEALENLQVYVKRIQARIQLLAIQRNVEGLSETIVTIIWSAVRLSKDIPELGELSKLFKTKYGDDFYRTSVTNTLNMVSPKMVTCLSVQPPPKDMIDSYLKEIASAHKLSFTPEYLGIEDEMKQVEFKLMEEHLSNSSLSKSTSNISIGSCQSPADTSYNTQLNGSQSSLISFDKQPQGPSKSDFSDNSRRSSSQQALSSLNFFDALYLTCEEQKQDLFDIKARPVDPLSPQKLKQESVKRPIQGEYYQEFKPSALLFDDIEEKTEKKTEENIEDYSEIDELEALINKLKPKK